MPAITVDLPRELRDFALSGAETRHDGSLDKVVCNALRLLKEREERRHELLATLNAAMAEADREEGIPLEEVMRQTVAIIEGGSRPKNQVTIEISEYGP